MSTKRQIISPARLAACEPCREAKVACDHDQPMCLRCRERQLTCSYRARPFKKRKGQASDLSNGTSIDAAQARAASESSSVSATQVIIRPPGGHVSTVQTPSSIDGSRGPHPNPGYLGSSSYVRIFEKMASNGGSDPPLVSTIPASPHLSNSPSAQFSDSLVAKGARLLQDIKNSNMFPACADLMDRWFARGSNLALANQFSHNCISSTTSLIASLESLSLTETSRRLCRASIQPLTVENTVEDFIASFTEINTRWETLSLAFLMLPRATFYVDVLASLYDGPDAKRAFRKTAISISDQCLELALSLDCMNDLQLIIQYENFIAHSYVDGDQSYASWRKLGDVASSLFALGYHEDVAGRPSAPAWLQALRKSTVARAYSADKNVAIFLGRPPRIHRKFFSFRVLGQCALRIPSEVNKEIWDHEALHHDKFCFEVDTWWSAMCARLKGEALDLSHDMDQVEQARQVRIIEAHAEAQWEMLPSRYHLNGPLKAHSSDPKERDFVVGAKLNHLHVLFLVRIAQAKFIPEPVHELVAVSVVMLNIVTEAILLRHYLSNSGTTVMWKLIYYGLPAAGIVCLYLLDRRPTTEDRPHVPKTKALQDLNVLVAEIESRAFTDTEDPNFDLLSSAAKTMQTIIEKLMSGDWNRPPEELHAASAQANVIDYLDDQQWLAWNNNLNLQDFETDFWLNLADHPALG